MKRVEQNDESWNTLVSVFDTTVTDNNLGNTIIMESVDRHLREIFPTAFFIRLPYLDSIGPESVKYLRQSAYVFFGGTNALSSDLRRYKQWGLDRRNIKDIRNVLLMGVGWWQYQSNPTWYTGRVLRKVLHRELLHSVRDSYTARQLQSAGFQNVLVTGCPTIWTLTEEHCACIPEKKADNVLLTFTDYKKVEALDYDLARKLQRRYKKIFFWCQGSGDYNYAKGCGIEMEVLAPNIRELDELLSSSIDLDYVGTRLHAGIRALQFKRRSLILGIDNRAFEKQRDFNLPVVKRNSIDLICEKIASAFKTDLRIPFASIATWKGQFKFRSVRETQCQASSFL